MPIGIVNKGPCPDDVGNRTVANTRVETILKNILSVGGSASIRIVWREGIIHLFATDHADRPPRPGAGHGDDVVLIVAVIDAHGEQLEQLASVVFVGHPRPVSAAFDRIQVDDFGRTFDVDFQQIVKCTVWIQQRLPPPRDLTIFKICRDKVHDAAIVVAIQVIHGLGVIRDEVVFKKLGENLQQLPRGTDCVQAIPTAHLVKTHTPVCVIQTPLETARRGIRRTEKQTAGKADGGGATAGGWTIPVADGVGLTIDQAGHHLEDGICVAAPGGCGYHMQTSSARVGYAVVHERIREICRCLPAIGERKFKTTIDQKIGTHPSHAACNELHIVKVALTRTGEVNVERRSCVSRSGGCGVNPLRLTRLISTRNNRPRSSKTKNQILGTGVWKVGETQHDADRGHSIGPDFPSPTVGAPSCRRRGLEGLPNGAALSRATNAGNHPQTI